MERQSVVVLGIPIDDLTMEEAVERIFEMTDAFEMDSRPRLVATVNVDFVVNTLSWRLKKARHPVLLDILRRSDLVTADGMPIVWTSKLLGTPLRGRVTGSDLVPRLAEVAARRGKTMYLLGGSPGSAENAATVLKTAHPALKIAGTESPYVHVEGVKLVESDEEDRKIVERINRAKTDILLIAFGNPKQEIWFDRNRHRLKVPVSIGVGGTFEFIAGSTARAPQWMQKAGIEWIYRITQDPKRLWKRYFVGFFKFGLLIWPAILHYRYRRFIFRYKKRIKFDTELTKTKPQMETGSAQVIVFPERLDAAYLSRNRDHLEKPIEDHKNLILDFSNVGFIDSTGLGFLVRTWRQINRDNRKLRMVGVRPPIVHFFKLNRLWDIFSMIAEENTEHAIKDLEVKRGKADFQYDPEEREEYVVFRLSGILTADQMERVDRDAFFKSFKGKDVIFNLGRLNFVDSTGLSFFLKALNYQKEKSKALVLCGIQDTVRQLFRITKLENVFEMTPDVPSAEKRLETSQ